ncbi:hypothetical protein LGM58_07135 [Burkholderia contaminans]|uniref:hypothetical protein n=1 Tax=Burkholderia contaminans TaxID=488447 RepID=UPI00104902F1|nr:hypothetical protein [Burkholderia contaminans]MCA7882957.1 hypothetical protein [Burkholderia contaminans]
MHTITRATISRVKSQPPRIDENINNNLLILAWRMGVSTCHGIGKAINIIKQNLIDGSSILSRRMESAHEDAAIR